jgi:lipopolysaccharide heptosyltransferase II
MRAERYDLVLDLQGLARSGTMAWLANGALTAGLGSSREGARGYYDVAVDRPAGKEHAVEWYLRVLQELGVPVHWDFEWLPERPEVAAAIQARWPVGGRRWLALCPGARWFNKRWPAAHFAELIRQLGRRHADLHFAILGGAEDLALGGELAAAWPGRCLDLTGRTSLPELVEWVRVCAGMVTNDTGPMHVAAALGRPVVAVFGPTAPGQTGPYGQVREALQNRALSCVPCLRAECRHEPPLECLWSLAPQRLADEITRRMA